MAITRARAVAPLALALAVLVALPACSVGTPATPVTVHQTVQPSAQTPATPAQAATPDVTAAGPTATSGPQGDDWDVEPCRLPDAAGGTAVGLGQPRNANRLPSTGDVTIAVIFADFPDAPASVSTADRFAALHGTEQWYSAVSYGRLAVHLVPDTHWVRMSKKSTAYSYATYDSHRAFVAEAVAAADPSYDFSNVDGVIVLVSDTQTALTFGPALTSSYGDGIIADGHEIANAVTSATDLDYWGYLWAVHELGHSFGLPDLYDYTGNDIHRHVGGFSVMGNIDGFAPEEFAYSRWQLGWIDDIAVECQTGLGGEFSIAPVEEQSAATQLVLVPVDDHTDVAVEYRELRGYDAGLSDSGVLVYVVDTSIPSGSGQVEVYPRKPRDRSTALLGAGESLIVDGVEVSVQDITDGQAHVYVGFGGE